MRVDRLATAGSVVGGVVASACCIGPLAFGLLGISGAAFAQKFAPFRPHLLVVTYALLGGAFYFTYGSRATCAPGSGCEMPRTNRFGKVLLWLAAFVVILTTTFPWYAQYLPL